MRLCGEQQRQPATSGVDKMARRVAYLSGGIAGLSYEDAISTRNAIKAELAEIGWDSLDPMRAKEVLSSLDTIDERSAKALLGVTDAAIVQRDYDDLRRADILLVLSGDRPSWGTAMEWAIAHFQLHKPVVVICAPDSPTREHPWCKTMTSYFASNIMDAVDFIDRWLDRQYVLS